MRTLLINKVKSRMKNIPFINAFAASVYIVIVSFVMNSMQSLPFPEEDTILAPMFVLSLFVLSAAVMGFLFLYQPFRLYFEDQKREAVLFFLKTVGTFAGFVAIFFISLLLTLPR